MIELTNVNATRLAFKISASTSHHLAHVRLDPDGSLWATDGIVLVRSLRAHDANINEPLYVSPPSRVSFSNTVLSFALSIEEGTLIERRARSEVSYDVEVKRGVPYPAVHNAIPSHLAERACSMPYFDSIIAGRVASDYGLQRGVWREGAMEGRVYLDGVDDTDLVILAAVREHPVEQG